MKVLLPFPPPELFPNRKMHWGKKAKVAKQFKADCYFCALDANVHIFKNHTRVKKFKLDFTFGVGNKPGRKPDEDNLIAAMKHGLDGLALAMRVDDAKFSIGNVERVSKVGARYALIELRAA